MITKTLTGIKLFDDRYGGVYRGRSFLVCGRTESGKTLFGLKFLEQGIRQGERCLMLSASLADDLIIYAESLGIPIGGAVHSGSLILLEYQNYVPGRDREEDMMLPPDGFLQFKQIIDTNAIQRVLLDTVLPWVAIRPQDNLAEHVFSFVRAFDRLGTTTLMTLPKPVSPMAFRLKNALEEVVPVSMMLHYDPSSSARSLHVAKYLGEKKLASEIGFVITPGEGFCLPGGRAEAPLPSARESAPRSPPPPKAPSFGAVIGKDRMSSSFQAAPGAGHKIRFSDALSKPGVSL